MQRSSRLTLSLCLLVVGSGAVMRAGPISYLVSATLQTGSVSGNVVYNGNTFVSANITAVSTGTGSFTSGGGLACANLNCASGATGVGYDDATGDILFINFVTPTPGSLAGFTSGPLLNGGIFISGIFFQASGVDAVVSGSIQSVAPEPSSLGLLGSALGALLVLAGRGRSARPESLSVHRSDRERPC
jgi:hypothetical protein